MNGTNRHELKWQLLRSFFTSRDAFLTLFHRYEKRILEFAGSLKMERSRLKLAADELQTVLDFKSLEELRDREILLLKETAHELFRESDATDRFDHYVSNIYHELSILKEEHYTLKEDFVRSVGAGGQSDPPLAVHGLRGVHHQVHDHLLDPVLVERHRG